MHTYKYIIVENLPDVADILKFFVGKFPKYEFKGLALNLSEAIQLIQKHKPHLVFLDIELNHESGFDLITLVEENNLNVPCVIVNSIIKDYAIKSFDIDAIYFVDKPYTSTKIETALNKFEKKYLEKNDTLTIRNQEGEHFIKYENIYFIEAKGTYSHLYTIKNETYRFSKNLKEMSLLLNTNFARVHRSFIVNKNHVDKIKEQKVYLKPLLLNNMAHDIETVIKKGIMLPENFDRTIF
jgi:two-component system LytT family response regulator